MNTIRNIIFDLDGTLIDSSPGVVEAVNYSLRQMGQPEQPPEAIRAFIGYPLSQMYPHFTDAPVEHLYRHFRVRAATSIVAATEPLPDVEPVLEQLAELGYRMAVATTKVRANVDGILDKLGWRHRFAASAAGDEVASVKPAPAIFKLTLKRLGATPSTTVIVGDTINDVLAAKAVPMKVVAVASPYGGREKVIGAQPDYFIESVADLVETLESHNAAVVRRT